MTERAELNASNVPLLSRQQELPDMTMQSALLREQIALAHRRGVAYMATRMVGRDAELQQLVDALYRVIETGATHLVTISGMPGIGKSRLLAEFDRCIIPLPEPPGIVQATASHQMRALPYSLIHDLFATLFAIHDDDNIDIALRKLEQGVISCLGPESLEKAHFIGYLLGFGDGMSPYLDGVRTDAAQICGRAVHYAAQLLAVMTAHRPIVCILEDVHWADTSSLDFLEWIVQEGHQIGLLLICPTRPSLFERYPDWGNHLARHVHLHLNPLSDNDSHKLLQTICLMDNLPEDIRNLIVRRAEGNPFWIEELMCMLVEDGILVHEAGRWLTRRHYLSGLRVPATLAEVIEAREDMLLPLERDILRRAAVAGRVFWLEALVFTGSEDGEQPLAVDISDSFSLIVQTCQTILENLQRKELICLEETAIFPGVRQYRFRHALLQEVIYERIPEPERRYYHTRIATWIIQQSSERIGEHLGTVVEHYTRAGELELAAVWCERAGRQASAAYAPEDAIEYYHQALTHLPLGRAYAAQRIAIYKDLGRMLGLQARFAQAKTTYRLLGKLAEEIGDLESQAHALQMLAWTLDNMGELPEALECAAQAEELARVAEVPDAMVMALFRKGWTLYHMGQTHAALATGEIALEISTECNAKMEMACSLNLLGAAHEMFGRWDQAVACKARALALHQEMGDLRGAGTMHYNLGCTAEKRGDVETALQLFTESLDACYQIGDREGEIFALASLGWTKIRLKNYASAEADLRQSIDHAEAVGMALLPTLYAYLTQALLGQGNVHEAILTAQQTLDLAQHSNKQGDIAYAWRVLGLAMAHLPQPNGAAVCFAEADKIYTEIDAPVDRAWVLRDWAKFELEYGDYKHGHSMWQEARAVFASLHMEADVAQMDTIFAQCAQAQP